MAILAAINRRRLMQGAALRKTNLAGHWCLNTAIPLLLLPSSHVPVHSFSSQIIWRKDDFFFFSVFFL